MNFTEKGAQYDHVNEGTVTEVGKSSVDYEYDFALGAWAGSSAGSHKGHAGFGITKVAKKARVGDRIKVYIHGGSLIGQVDLNEKPVHWVTPEQEKASHAKWLAKEDLRKQAEFKKQKARLDADYAALPKLLQLRLDVFRRFNPDFRVDYEGYEMVVCKDAVKILGIPKGDLEEADEWYRKFKDMGYKAQQGILQSAGVTLDPDLSGNQFDMIISLAWRLEMDPKQAFQWHGAMTPLTGCIEYGCPHPRKLIEGGYWVDEVEWEKQKAAG